MVEITKIIILAFLYTTNGLVQNRSKNVHNVLAKKLSNCKFELDDGGIIDLGSLDNPSNPL